MTDALAEDGFLILHGWQNHRPAGHWEHWLAERLTAAGHAVDYPALPDPDHPDLEVWLAELRERLGALRGRRRTVVCHSLACVLWLHAAARGDVAVPVDRVLLVAPPSAGYLGRYPEVAAFAPPRVSAAQLYAGAGYVRMVGGDDDPCCPQGADAVFAEPLGLPVDVLAGQGHLGEDAGYGPWPSLLDWCVGRDDDAPIRSRAH
ncbi:alpha/beta hydrolase [Streptomyces sp. H27-G5]|uniref:RBBP9/YdeN family alpha/beta hydrolase n=1 Tax=Streptomyces sp. H27-G5 TaxID=2996698 RepID=UPI00226D5EBA|nr:alpha/beta hydrolase [Streptomyces sp. H27-G5]MCY0916867.1 alpha/beta hydrolase [Streptomyces sp. H27-G5]